MLPENAVDFHSDIAILFNEKYKNNLDFIERYKVWTTILNNLLTPNMRVIDAGCGSGIFSFYLASKGCAVLGIDGAKNMINICKQISREQNFENIEFQEHNLPLTNFPDQWRNQDLILASSVLEYIEDIDKTLQNFKDLLRPDNGYLVLSMPNAQCWYRKLEKWFYFISNQPQYYSFVKHTKTLKEFETMLLKHGFKLQNYAYYGGNSLIFKILRTFLPTNLTTNLFVAVFESK
jgi:2-polyprenyl-3-methyl-5-hydroxy-6-metoxy-1,4-benzoquinol methylase